MPGRVAGVWWAVIGVLLFCSHGMPLLGQDKAGVASNAGATGRRVALLIGNKGYVRRPLVNPINDATDLEVALRELGFETRRVVDVDLKTFDQEVRAFRGRIRPGDVALFYFSGHGLEAEGRNYLLPVNFEAESEELVQYSAVPAQRVIDGLRGAGAGAIVAILDACRDNPYKSWRSEGGGLVSMRAQGTYIAFAADAGQRAADNPGGRNGLFTQELLRVLKKPGLSVDDVFNEVRGEVMRKSDGKQVPFSNTGLVGRLELRPNGKSPKVEVEEVYWGECQRGTAGACEVYLRKYPQGSYAELAQLKASLAGRVAVNPAEGRNESGVEATRKPGMLKRNELDGLNYAWIPEGSYRMGCSEGDKECYDDEGKKAVTIQKGFWLGESEVTQGAYEQVMGSNPSHFKGLKLPVERITWEEAREYCEKVGGRLPNEEEWEYAARAGSEGARYGSVGDTGWYGGNSGGETHEAKGKVANGWGLYDMLGNVWEWTSSDYDSSNKVLRGGSWLGNARDLRVSDRNWNTPTNRNSNFGFRCARDQNP